MKTLPFKPITPGIRTLWVIAFYPPSSLDFFIPSPFNRNEWINTEVQTSKQALTLLGRINKECREIKQECQHKEHLRNLNEYVEKAQGVVGHLKNLDTLMKDFEELMKKFSPPPTKEPESEEEER